MIPVTVVGISHKTAPLPVRERFSFTNREALELLESLRDYSGMTEGVVLSTCHRTELYICPGTDQDLIESARSALKVKAGDLVGVSLCHQEIWSGRVRVDVKRIGGLFARPRGSVKVATT